MTQPVQEPNQGRINQGVAFKQRQLFRRPSGGAMPWVLIDNVDSPKTLANNDFTWMDNLVLRDFSGEDFVTISTSGVGTDALITIDAPGLYLAQRVDEADGSGGATLPDVIRTGFNKAFTPWDFSRPGEVFSYPSAQDDQDFVTLEALAMFTVATTQELEILYYIEDATGTWTGISELMITRLSS